MNTGKSRRITSFYQKTISDDGRPGQQVATYQERFFDTLANMDALGARHVIDDALQADIPPGTMMPEVFCSTILRCCTGRRRRWRKNAGRPSGTIHRVQASFYLCNSFLSGIFSKMS